MGKRKSSAKPVASKKRMVEKKLETVFTCPFCNHGGSVECEFDKKEMMASAICYICQASYWTRATTLTEPIDIYDESRMDIEMNAKLAASGQQARLILEDEDR